MLHDATSHIFETRKICNEGQISGCNELRTGEWGGTQERGQMWL